MAGRYYASIASDRKFRLLRGRFRRWVAAVVVVFIGWYFVYIVLSAFARDFMSHPIVGNINVGMVLGVLQFLSTFLIAYYHTRFARANLDPLSEQLRTEAEFRQAEYERVAAEHRRMQAEAQRATGERRLDPTWWGEKK
ncbi:hypothetical protein GCM10027589_54140 [Actinocorallia lasiicapitis]